MLKASPHPGNSSGGGLGHCSGMVEAYARDCGSGIAGLSSRKVAIGSSN